MTALLAWSTFSLAVISGGVAVPIAWRGLILFKKRRAKKENAKYWSPVIMAVAISAIFAAVIHQRMQQNGDAR